MMMMMIEQVHGPLFVTLRGSTAAATQTLDGVQQLQAAAKRRAGAALVHYYMMSFTHVRPIQWRDGVMYGGQG